MTLRQVLLSQSMQCLFASENYRCVRTKWPAVESLTSFAVYVMVAVRT